MKPAGGFRPGRKISGPNGLWSCRPIADNPTRHCRAAERPESSRGRGFRAIMAGMPIGPGEGKMIDEML
jgi:hypothetical protein